jgi:hypothetical protein
MKPFQSRQCLGFSSFLVVFLAGERFDGSTGFFSSSHSIHRCKTHHTPLLLVDHSQRDSLSSSSISSIQNERRVARRWNGNHKSVSTSLCDVPKAKKLTLELSIKRHDGSIVTKTLLKKRQETLQHVLTKAMLWKLYCDDYQDIEIEEDIGDKDYLPDVISLDADGRPIFWGESGRMKVHKAVDLMKRYPEAHIVHCRWDMGLPQIEAPLIEHLQDLFDTDALGNLPDRPGRFTLCSMPLDVWRFIDEETGFIHITESDLEWKELVFPNEKSTSSVLT